MVIVLKHGSYLMRLSLVKINELKPHEEIVPNLVRKLKDNILRDGVYTHPIIVDINTLTILDGMHRYNALKELGANFIPAVLVDYDHSGIKIKRWWRLFDQDIHGELKKILARWGIPSKLPGSTYLELREAGNTEYFPTKNSFNAYNIMKKLEKILVNSGHKVEYVHEDLLNEALKEGKIGFAASPLTKREVRKIGLSGLLLPHKSTCHVFPARIHNVNVPLEILFLDDIKEAMMLTERLLKNRKIIRKKGRSPITEVYYVFQ